MKSKTIPTAPPGRTCATKDCTARLSIYNLEHRCSIHEPKNIKTDPKVKWEPPTYGLCGECGALLTKRGCRLCGATAYDEATP